MRIVKLISMSVHLSSHSVAGLLLTVALSMLLISCRSDPSRNYSLYEYRTFRLTGSGAEMREQLQKLYKAGWTEEPGITYPFPGDPGYSDILMMRAKQR
jgi:hypothetical protein